MTNISISTTYDLVWQFKTHPHLKVDKKGNIVNVKTGRLRKMVLNGGSVGIWLDSETFVCKSKLNSMLEKIEDVEAPF